MYEYHNNILSIPARLLYEDWGYVSYKAYKIWCYRKKLIRTKEGKGKGNEAFLSFYDLPEELKQLCIKRLGDPKKEIVRNKLEQYMQPDKAAITFFASHRKPNGIPLSQDSQREKTTNAIILNAIKIVFKDPSVKKKIFGGKKTQIWENISTAVNNLNTHQWKYSLPGNPRALQRKYESYLEEGYTTFIHTGEGTENARIIKGEIADFLLAHYCLPIKLTVPEVLERYTMARANNNWKQLTESAVKKFLNKPENERIWTLARQGRSVWNKKYKHTLTRDKKDWFPNAYWVIDGTKLDWIHFYEKSANKMGAILKIDVVFDVYSEKIIGWSLSFTENHTDHFKAIKRAVNESQCRPYYITYDHQAGHKTKKIQDLYTGLVAIEGGIHHPNKAKNHSNPSEQLFKRFQQQVITKFWFSDGQGVTVKSDHHKANMDFIDENKHLLKTTDELYQAWETAVHIWNAKQHPKFQIPRNQVYTHEMPMREELSLLDIMDNMWLEETKKPITYRAHGLDMWLADVKYQFEVYDNTGGIDLEFRRKNMGKKFTVRYDPDFLDGYIQLCEPDESGNTVVVARAEPKRQHQNIPALMKLGDKEVWMKDQAIKDAEYHRDFQDYQKLMKRAGVTRQTEIENQDYLIKYKGHLPKNQRSLVESEENIVSNF